MLTIEPKRGQSIRRAIKATARFYDVDRISRRLRPARTQFQREVRPLVRAGIPVRKKPYAKVLRPFKFRGDGTAYTRKPGTLKRDTKVKWGRLPRVGAELRAYIRSPNWPRNFLLSKRFGGRYAALSKEGFKRTAAGPAKAFFKEVERELTMTAQTKIA